MSVRHIDAPPRNTDARTLAGRASDVVVTTTGDVAVDVRTAQGRRLQVSRPRHSLRTVSRAALGPVFEKGRGSLVSWGTRLVAVTEAPSGYIPDVVHPVDPATGRQVNDCKTGAPHVSRLESESVDARVANARSWAPAGTTAEKELTVCSPGGKRLLSRVLSEGDASDVTSDRVAVSVAGPVVVATRVRFDGGDSGTGTEVLVNRSAFVVAPDGRSIEVHVPQLVAASPAAVAFVDDGTLQISDADGFRSVVLAPPTVAGLYQLALEGSGAIVRTESGDAQSVPLRPLPARAVKSFGGGVSTTATIDSP